MGASTGATRVPRFALLLALYVSQYLGIGFLAYGATAILRTMGASLESLSALTTLGMLWALKILWAPLIDRWGWQSPRGHYRSWLLVVQPAMAIVLASLAFITDLTTHFGLFVLITAVYILLSATQDVAVDALAVRIITPQERPKANGIQVSGSFIGNVIGGGLTAVLYDLAGWRVAILTLAVLTILPTLLVAAFHEPAHTQPARRASLRDLWTVTRQPGAKSWMFVAVPLAWGGLTAAYAMITPALVDAGWSVSRIGTVVTIFGSSVAALVGLGTGSVIQRMGRGRSLLLSGVGTAVGIALLVPFALEWAPLAYALLALAVFMAAYTVGSTIVSVINMDYARSASPGTDFTTMSTVGMLVSFAAGAIALYLAAWVGYAAVLVASMAVYAVGVALLVRHQRRHRTEGLNRDSGAELVSTT